MILSTGEETGSSWEWGGILETCLPQGWWGRLPGRPEEQFKAQVGRAFFLSFGAWFCNTLDLQTQTLKMDS